MKRYCIALLFFFVLFLSPPHILAEEIQEFDVSITINPNGSVDVLEMIRYNFEGEQRHGIFRTIPFIKTNTEGKKFELDFQNFSVTDELGKVSQFSRSKEGSFITLKIGDPNTTISGEHIYRIGYSVGGGLTYFPDHDELYWNVTGNDWEVPISRAGAQIRLPQEVGKDDIQAECFTGPSGSITSDCTILRTNGVVQIDSTGMLESGEGLTAVVGFPKGIVAVLEPEQVVPFFETFVGKIALICLGLVAFLWYIVSPILVFRHWLLYGRDPRPAMGETSAWFSPPKTKTLRSLTPAETGTLIDEVVHSRDIFATIVDLARRGYFKIFEEQGVFSLVKANGGAADTTLQPFEQHLLEGIFDSQTKVSLKNLQLHKTFETVKTDLYTALVTEGFFPRNPHTIRALYQILTFFSFISLNPFMFLASWIFGQHMPRKSLFGAQAATVARSLRNFLKSQEVHLSYQARNQLFFEKLLPFAVAYGVEEIWAKRFATVAMTPPDWYVSSTGGRFNSTVFARSLNRGYATSFASSVQKSSVGFSSGFSGGGSSGGGGGGGGGGSW